MRVEKSAEVMHNWLIFDFNNNYNLFLSVLKNNEFKLDVNYLAFYYC